MFGVCPPRALHHSPHPAQMPPTTTHLWTKQTEISSPNLTTFPPRDRGCPLTSLWEP